LNDTIHPQRLSALQRAVPSLFGPGTLLNVGANRVRFELGTHLAAVGREITLLEVWPANAAAYDSDRRVRRVVTGDVRRLAELDLGTFDACLWWHGPEHIDKAELAGALAGLEAAAGRLVVLGCPWGVYPQGPFMDNPHDAHRAALYPADLEALGYSVVALGEADHPDGGLIAWKRPGRTQEGGITVKQNDDTGVVHVVMLTHGDRLRHLERTIPAVLATPYPLTLTVVANAPDKASLAYLDSVGPRLYRVITRLAAQTGRPGRYPAAGHRRPQRRGELAAAGFGKTQWPAPHDPGAALRPGRGLHAGAAPHGGAVRLSQ
jgi:hypothetical protein